MKTLRPTTQYKKDLKRYKNQPKKLAALRKVLLMLKNEQRIPNEYYPHTLKAITRIVWNVIYREISC